MIDRGGRLEPIPQSDPVEPALGLPVERADAILPADLLQGGEVIILLLKPSLLYIVLGCLGTLALIAGTAALLIGLRQVGAGTFSTSEVLAGASLLITIRVGWQALERHTPLAWIDPGEGPLTLPSVLRDPGHAALGRRYPVPYDQQQVRACGDNVPAFIRVGPST